MRLWNRRGSGCRAWFVGLVGSMVLVGAAGAGLGEALIEFGKSTATHDPQAMLVSLTVDKQGEGTVKVDGVAVELPYNAEYPASTSLELEAIAAEGWEFDRWGLHAAFTVDPNPAEVGETVSFDASGSAGNIVQYSWEFGDGATAVGMTAEHTYASDGVYQVKLTVEDSEGATATAQANMYIYPGLPPPPGSGVLGRAQHAPTVGDLANDDEHVMTVNMDTDKTITAHFRRVSAPCPAIVPGWTFFGLPVEPQDPGFAALQIDPEPTDVHMFWWDPDAEAYEGRGELELQAMRGYWLFVTHDYAEYQVCLEGTPLTGDQEYQLGARGWQMISVPYPVAWGDSEGGSIHVRHGQEEKTLQEAIDAMWLHHTLSAWDADAEEWNSLRATDGATLQPWTGYFLFVHQDDLVLHYSEEEQGQALWNEGQALSPAALSFDPGEPPLPPLLAVEPTAEELVAVAYPNPVVDGGGVTFTVRGPAARWVEAIRVRVHDLSGRLVYQAESAGASLSWDTVASTGKPVASGVYLYTVHAKLNGEWVSAGVDRLLILR